METDKLCVVVLKEGEKIEYLGKFGLSVAKIMKEEYQKENCEFLIFEEGNHIYEHFNAYELAKRNLASLKKEQKET